ncbi:hypothetical protein BDV93DRAFT_520444 [Ceratobasidium sp. AG-I]|nr:hypothetical protein BDV93DRAFT_520444 [Ceratobasidium sp. AG-I]
MRLVDGIVVPTMRSIASVRNLVAYARELQGFFSTSSIEDYAALRIRLRHGAARVSALRNMYAPVTVVQGITYQHLCPTSFLLGLFAALVFVSSTPIGAAGWLFSGGLLLLVAYSSGASELERDNEGEGDDALFDSEEYPMVDTNLAPVIEQF